MDNNVSMPPITEADIVVIGGGPAGLSAALNGRVRNRSVVIITNDPSLSGLYKAEKISNYPGMPDVSGAEMLKKMTEQAEKSGAVILPGKVLNIMAFSGKFMVGYGTEIITAGAVVIATGAVPSKIIAGEKEFLGRGVSYCATCDGMLYRGKRVLVAGNAPDINEELEYLRGIGCDAELIKEPITEIKGDDFVNEVITKSGVVNCDGIFILRKSVAFTTMLPELETENGFIKVDRQMCTSVPGVFAAGDCTGKPLQAAKAVGEGLVAGLSADAWLSR